MHCLPWPTLRKVGTRSYSFVSITGFPIVRMDGGPLNSLPWRWWKLGPAFGRIPAAFPVGDAMDPASGHESTPSVQ